jgi:hypothetical protein
MAKTMDEQLLLREVVKRLTARYPTLSPATVAEVVGDLQATFAGAPLREFVPPFVERRAKTALDELSVSYEGLPTAVGQR